MHATGPRALSSPLAFVLVARLAPSTRRSFQTSPRLRRSAPDPASTSPERGKPPGRREQEQQGTSEKPDTDTSIESTTKRPRLSAFAPSRPRSARPRPSNDLPPVRLPTIFLNENIWTHDPAERLNTLADDPIWHRGYVGAQWHDWLWQDLEVVLDTASWDQTGIQHALDQLQEGHIDDPLRRSEVIGETARWLKLCLREKWSPGFRHRALESDTPEDLPTAFLDAKKDSSIVAAILSPDRKAGPMKEKGERGSITNEDRVLRARIESHIRQPALAEEVSPSTQKALEDKAETCSLEYHGSRIFDSKLLGELTTAVRAEFTLAAEETDGRREVRRPLIVVNIPNYSGKYATRKLAMRIASQLEADLLRVDAQDLAMIVGCYLGQDTAYSKGPMSMLAYRTAEMNGRLTKGIDSSRSGDEDLSGDMEGAWVNIRQHASGGSFKTPIEEELQKIKDGARDYVLPSIDRWENLKINAALEHIIQAAATKSGDSTRPLIIHVDNFVELNMTLEGALLLGRMRSLIDDMWQGGRKIVLMGTSAVQDPSDQYISTLGEIASEECLITFPLQLHKIPSVERKKERRESIDFLHENLRNIHIMSRALSTRGNLDTSYVSELAAMAMIAPGAVDSLDGISTGPSGSGHSPGPGEFPIALTTTVLPCPDVYHAARLLHAFEPIDERTSSEKVLRYFLDVLGSKTITSGTEQFESPEDKQPTSESHAPSKPKVEPERMAPSGKYNEFEKKLLTGLVDVTEIRTTFSDVHAPPETIAALRLLTSLSLMRPEAFTYGILANDRIPGCLLYGPPGTGKTLLAKAVAKESGASMLEVSGASINDMGNYSPSYYHLFWLPWKFHEESLLIGHNYVGQSEKNVRALFSLAKKLSPLVIFIDEADALFAARGQSRSRPSHRETINQFLREWDGMSDTKAFIMVATNRPFDLDDAVLRRLPRKILVDLPLRADRAAILGILLKDERLDRSVSVDAIAHSTALYSGSDLKNLSVAAAMAAVQEELEDAGRHTGPEPFVYPERRTLCKRHFDKAAQEIAASISEDMDSLKAIRNFDQKYGDQRRRQKKPKSMGFGLLPSSEDAEDARVRQPVSA